MPENRTDSKNQEPANKENETDETKEDETNQTNPHYEGSVVDALLGGMEEEAESTDERKE